MNIKPISTEEAFAFSLPKWPQMLVNGKDVTIEQTKEIIFSTDSNLINLYGMFSNDHKFADSFNDMVGYDNIGKIRSNKNYPNKYSITHEIEIKVQTSAGFLSTNYVTNNWVSSSYVYGSPGWCHPNGKIHYVDNVGKWPNVEEIYSDWEMIAKRWVFLDLWVTIMDSEMDTDDSKPLVSFHVKDGLITLYEGTVEPHTHRPMGRNDSNFIFGPSIGIPLSWVNEFINKVRPIVDESIEEVLAHHAEKS
jgi:hypothetical protein